ncbi:MAG: hypothetical protein JWL79_150 [Frankiales bacterium]|nr:hypothetical protein [Frankiales bacterium]
MCVTARGKKAPQEGPPPPAPKVRAIALDANSFGSRHLNLARLTDVVDRLDEHGAFEVWLPDPVVWEWAEHAYAERYAALSALRNISATGLTLPELAEVTRERVLAEIERLLDVGPVLVRLEVDGVAAAGLRDQIMLTGPAKTRIDSQRRLIKTGASDSSTLRALLEAADGDTDVFVIVSSDKDVPAAFKAWQISPPRIYSSVKDALTAVFKTVPPEHEVPWECMPLLARHLDDVELGRLRGGNLFSRLSDLGYEGGRQPGSTSRRGTTPRWVERPCLRQVRRLPRRGRPSSRRRDHCRRSAGLPRRPLGSSGTGDLRSERQRRRQFHP